MHPLSQMLWQDVQPFWQLLECHCKILFHQDLMPGFDTESDNSIKLTFSPATMELTAGHQNCMMLPVNIDEIWMR